MILKNQKVIQLLGYGKRIYQNREELYTKGFRDKQEKDVGVGITEIVEASKLLKSLVGIKCDYAVKFFDNNAYFLQKCRISEKQKKVLSDLVKE